MPQHIVVTDYDPRWPSMFKKEAAAIRDILNENCIALFHIGSTSVPGLKAKPIIDMMPVVKSLKKVDDVSKKFEMIGYEYLGEFGIANRRYLRKGGNERTHQIHIFRADNQEEIARHLAVRDYLRAHKETADEYGRLKEKLAAVFPYDIDSYCQGKDPFMKALEQQALLWYNDNFSRSKADTIIKEE